MIVSRVIAVPVHIQPVCDSELVIQDGRGRWSVQCESPDGVVGAALEAVLQIGHRVIVGTSGGVRGCAIGVDPDGDPVYIERNGTEAQRDRRACHHRPKRRAVVRVKRVVLQAVPLDIAVVHGVAPVEAGEAVVRAKLVAREELVPNKRATGLGRDIHPPVGRRGSARIERAQHLHKRTANVVFQPRRLAEGCVALHPDPHGLGAGRRFRYPGNVVAECRRPDGLRWHSNEHAGEDRQHRKNAENCSRHDLSCLSL